MIATFNRYLVILPIVFSTLFLTGCFTYEEVTVENVSDVKIKKFSAKSIDVEVALQIKNPNKYKISIVDSDLELFVKNSKIGSATIKENIVLPKKSNKVHRFTIQTTYKQILSGAVPTLIGLIGKKSVELGVKGSIKARAKSISKRFPVEFKERVQL